MHSNQKETKSLDQSQNIESHQIDKVYIAVSKYNVLYKMFKIHVCRRYTFVCRTCHQMSHQYRLMLLPPLNFAHFFSAVKYRNGNIKCRTIFPYRSMSQHYRLIS
jgi:hypothetical protein